MEDELKRAHAQTAHLDAQLRQLSRETVKLNRIVQVGRRALHADLTNCVDADLLNSMLEAEGEKAARREAEMQQGLSPEELLRRVRESRI